MAISTQVTSQATSQQKPSMAHTQSSKAVSPQPATPARGPRPGHGGQTGVAAGACLPRFGMP